MTKALTFFILFFMFGCCKNIEVYKNNTPKISMKDFYSKNLKAYGVIFDFFGRAKSRITMTSTPGKIEDYTDPKNPNLKLKKMYLNQTMNYIEDKKEKKFISYAIFDENGTIFKYKDEMMLEESEYKMSGNTSNVKYDLNVERDNGSTIIVSADDWFYLVDEKTGINRIDLRKFGIKVSHIIMTIRQE